MLPQETESIVDGRATDSIPDAQTNTVMETMRFVLAWMLFGLLYHIVGFGLKKWLSTRHEADSKQQTTTKKSTYAVISSKMDPKENAPAVTPPHAEIRNAATVQNGRGARVYGLEPQDLANHLYDSDDGEGENLTMREIRKLQKTPEFRRWCAQKKMSVSQIQDEHTRIFVFKKLKELNPESFWQLCRPDTLVSIDMVPPSSFELVAEYIMSRLIDLSVWFGIGWFVYRHCKNSSYSSLLWSPQVVIGLVILWKLCIRHWISGRPSGGKIFGGWYHDTVYLGQQYTTVSGVCRVVVASLVESIFVIGSLGIGILISSLSRLFSEGNQSIGEKIAGISLVMERKIRQDTGKTA